MITNLWKRLRQIVPTPPLLVGEVIAVSSWGATVQLPEGVTMTARGSATVGQKVFIRDGVIEGVAPALPVVLIEI